MAKTESILWFWHLKREVLLLFYVIPNLIFRGFGVMVGQDILGHNLGLSLWNTLFFYILYSKVLKPDQYLLDQIYLDWVICCLICADMKLLFFFFFRTQCSKKY